MKKAASGLAILFGLAFSAGPPWSHAAESRGVEHGRRYDRLVIRNVMVIDGKGTPMRGPMDVVVEGNKIAALRGANTRPDAHKSEAHVLDGTGMYLLPGLINSHVHLHDERAGIAQPFEYEYKVYLSCGVTTVRDVGTDPKKALAERRKSQEGSIIAPRLYIYLVAGGATPEEGRKSVRSVKEQGADGVKIFGLDRDIMAAIVDESKKLGLKVAHHVGVEETDARDAAAFGVATMEHWYGIPDAALKGSQNFPPSYNYNNESDRFRWAGRLWREADPAKLKAVLDEMIAKGVAWVPTFSTYEACRDMTRARNLPWFKEYLHPALEAYFHPSPSRHGAFSWGWSTEDEIAWKENYRIWMKAVRDFADRGGLVGAGDDAGFIYTLYGFTYLSELELLQEAGFHPIDVIQCATGNNAKLMGLEDRLGRVRQGFLADLILLDENPLANLKYLYPTGVLDIKDGKDVIRGGIKWTIKDGIVYSTPRLMQDVKDMVREARAKPAGPR
ncbi:MAG: amidohydrolase family protein [Candidatus Aminicenantes bacterium]|nr:amidohydrolase family protein [Candidatus Aminicenantes bacterium]